MSQVGRWAARGAAAVATVAGGAIVWGQWAAPTHLPLPPPVSGERRSLEGRAGHLAFYVAGEGRPILLVHSINAAASAYEVGPLFHALSRSRRVYAVDLPGFGFSDRSPRRYDVPLFVDAVHDMLDAIRAEHGHVPVDILALSLSAEFAARAASERPDAVGSLTLVTPTGFERGSSMRRSPTGASREVAGLAGFLEVPIWDRALYNLLVTRPSIRFFLEKTWGSKQIDEGVMDYAYLTSHQPGARHAPYAFVSGRLFSADIRTVYERLRQPVLVLHGTRGDFQDFSESGWARSRPNWRIVPMDTGALPQFERLSGVLGEVEPFLGRSTPAGQGSSSPSRSPSP